jgi:uncharacterized protein
MAENRLIIFLKAPRPGTVKTRLAEALGYDGACAAYEHMVRRLMENLRALSGVELRHTPDDGRADIAVWVREGWQTRPQGPGALGERLIRAFDEQFRSGPKRVVVIGSDCPSVTVEDIRRAWASLETHDLVLGPARDGGYWLIGLREEHPELFQGIAWSTETVLSQTVKQARAAGLQIDLLDERGDIDTAEDWARFINEGKPPP